MQLPASTLYLLEHSGVAPDRATPQEILVSKARTIRNLIHTWWLQLDPEHTAGVSVELMESLLVTFAETLVGLPKQRIGKQQALGVVTRKLVTIHGRAEILIAQRFFDATERLGVLRGAWKIFFAHPSLLDLFLGLGYQTKEIWPRELEGEGLFSLKPLDQPWGRALWARLAFAEPDLLEDAFWHVASRNLHLATWFLYQDRPAREELGEALAAFLLQNAAWGRSSAELQALDQMLASLGESAAPAARECLLEGTAILPAMGLAARVLGRYGGPEDLENLQALLADPALGFWEIDRMRQALREAQSLTLEPETLRRCRKEELAEFRKTALRVLFLIGGALALAQLKIHHRLPGLELSRSTAEAGAHALQHGIVHVAQHHSEDSASEVLALQRTLRERLAFLPQEIESRKTEIERARPQVYEEIRAAVRDLGARG